SNLTQSTAVSAPLPWPYSLSGVQVLLDGKPAQILYVSSQQGNFLVPLDRAVAPAQVTVGAGSTSIDLPTPTPVALAAPGIFYDASTGYGRVFIPGTGQATEEQPATKGGYVEIYATGLGPVGDDSLTPQVKVGGLGANVIYHGVLAGTPGVYQVNAQI